MNAAQPVNFIRFHGLTLLVVEHGGVEYIDPRALCELAGMQWKGARRTLSSAENTKLYGTTEFSRPEIAGLGTTSCPEAAIHIRLDRARMFLARINTAHMKAKGNVDAADALLALQIEWAEALHAYETDGVAVKKGHREARAELIGLLKARGTPPTPVERMALSALISETFASLGQPLAEDAQLKLQGV